MKVKLNITLCLGLLTAVLILFSSFDLENNASMYSQMKTSATTENSLKKEALKILDTKCNICHRKQNPFMIFKEKNMSMRAKKIYKMVFIERRMPKGNDIRLTNKEYATLEKWLLTEEIY